MECSAREALSLLRSRRHALERGAPVAAGSGEAACAVDAAREIAEIDAAIGRIDAGSFGSCEACGGAIGYQRLRALPEVRFCAACSAP